MLYRILYILSSFFFLLILIFRCIYIIYFLENKNWGDSPLNAVLNTILVYILYIKVHSNDCIFPIPRKFIEISHHMSWGKYNILIIANSLDNASRKFPNCK